MPAAIAFMVMPFNAKATDRAEPGVPAKIDFDALWERVYQPVLQGAGYTAVRADSDIGALIVSEMIQRLALADLVVADITLPNANVYYEIGVRHAAKPAGCVLVAAEWSKPVFDLGQMRQLRFPLTDGSIGPEAVTAASAALSAGLAGLVDGGSPVFDAVPGYPGDVDISRVSAFKADIAELSEFDADIRAARAAPESERRERALAIVKQHGGKKVVRDAVVLELIRLVRDNVGWQEACDYIATLPDRIARRPQVLEQRALAVSETGDPVTAIGTLQELITQAGETSERLALLGGRYKRLWRAAEKPAERRRYLNRAIDAYERGMLLDLNDYYPAVNLFQLARARGEAGDDQRARDAEAVTAVACRAALAQGRDDEWVRPTLLNLAFDRGDLAGALQLRRQIEDEGPAAWKLETTLDDLRASAARQPDHGIKAGLEEIVSELAELLPAAAVQPPAA
jgi:hypothetical protein